MTIVTRHCRSAGSKVRRSSIATQVVTPVTCSRLSICRCVIFTMRRLPTTHTPIRLGPSCTVHRSYQGDKRKIWQGGNTKAMDLYRLPAVIEAIKNDTTIYIVEGEKDVHAVESLGRLPLQAPRAPAKWSKINPSPLTAERSLSSRTRTTPGANMPARSSPL